MSTTDFHFSTTPFGSQDFLQKAEHFVHPNESDVLSGRGGFVNAHPGNVRFRELVQARKTEYSLETNKERKMEICREVIALVHNKGGQFLAKETGSSLWKTMSDERIVAKTNQALREGAPKIREAFQEKAKRTFRGKRSFQASSSELPQPVPTQTEEPQQAFFPITDQSRVISVGSVNSGKSIATMLQQGDDGQRSATVSPILDNISGEDGYSSGDSIRQLFFLAANPPTYVSTAEPMKIPNEFDELERIHQEVELKRKHSLILSDISPSPNYLREEFQNPFQNESWFLNPNSDAGIGSLFENSFSSLQRGVSSSLPQEYSV